MHDKPSGASDDERASTAALDLRDQAVVLTHVLALYPAYLQLGELVQEVCAGSLDFIVEGGDVANREGNAAHDGT